jgi:hypothetical protein
MVCLRVAFSLLIGLVVVCVGLQPDGFFISSQRNLKDLVLTEIQDAKSSIDVGKRNGSHKKMTHRLTALT